MWDSMSNFQNPVGIKMSDVINSSLCSRRRNCSTPNPVEILMGFLLIILPLTRFGSLGAGEILARAHHVRCLKPFNGYIRVDGWSWSSTSLRKPLVKKNARGRCLKLTEKSKIPTQTNNWLLSEHRTCDPLFECYILARALQRMTSVKSFTKSPLVHHDCPQLYISISIVYLYTCIPIYLYIILYMCIPKHIDTFHKYIQYALWINRHIVAKCCKKCASSRPSSISPAH